MLHFLANQIAQLQPAILEMVAQAKLLTADALSSIATTLLLFPTATLKYFEITNLLKELDPIKYKPFITSVRPFVQNLRNTILDLNKKMQEIDREISYFGGFAYDELVWSGNSSVVELSTSWNKLVSSGIILPEECSVRLLRETIRYAFFVEINKFLTVFHDAHVYNLCLKRKTLQKEKNNIIEPTRNPSIRTDSEEGSEQHDLLNVIETHMAEEEAVKRMKKKLT